MVELAMVIYIWISSGCGFWRHVVFVKNLDACLGFDLCLFVTGLVVANTLYGGIAFYQLAATKQWKNLRARLESKLEIVMSDRFRTRVDLHVRAPRLVIPVDVHVATDVAREALVVDLGRIGVATARLAHLRSQKRDRQESASSSGAGGSERDTDRGRNDHAESSRGRGGPTPWRMTRALSSSSVGTGAEGSGRRWHANFYDVYNIEVSQVGVRLRREYIARGNGVARGSETPTRNDDRGGRAPGWLVNPFDVKVSENAVPCVPCVRGLRCASFILSACEITWDSFFSEISRALTVAGVPLSLMCHISELLCLLVKLPRGAQRR